MNGEGDDVQHEPLEVPEVQEKKAMPLHLIIWIGVLLGIFIGIGIVTT
ncbi:MAG: hypothetical protein HKO13_00270 [Sphingomonas sp.]|nr:hypothetical protein [Sphingomonas sp.]